MYIHSVGTQIHTVSIDRTILTRTYTLLLFKSYPTKPKNVLIQKTLKNVQLKRRRIQRIRVSLITLARHRMILIPSAIARQILTQTGLYLLENTLQNFLISIITYSVTIREKKSRQTLQNSIQIYSRQARRSSLILNNAFYTISLSVITRLLQQARIQNNCF